MGKKETRRNYLATKYFGWPLKRINDECFAIAVEKFLIDHKYLKKVKDQIYVKGLSFNKLRAIGFIQMILDFEEKKEGEK